MASKTTAGYRPAPCGQTCPLIGGGKSLARVALCVLALAIFCTPGLALGLRFDFLDTHPMTDRYWYYHELDVDTMTVHPISEKGKFPEVNGDVGTTDTTRIYDVPAITINRSQALQVRVFLNNLSGPARSGTITLLNPYSDPFNAWVTGGVIEYSVGEDSTAWTEPFEIGVAPSVVWHGLLTLDVEIVDSMQAPWQTATAIQYFIPLEPPVNRQAIVWHEIVGYTCSWAMGKSTEDEVAKAVVLGLYGGNIFQYNLPSAPLRWLNNEEAFALRELLNWLDIGVAPANCMDIATFCSFLMQSQGLDKVQQITTGNLPFVTNLMCPIGSNPASNANYIHALFVYHAQTARPNGERTYDASLALLVDLAGNEYRLPPMQWDVEGYWQTESELEDPMFYGLVFGPYVAENFTTFGGNLQPRHPSFTEAVGYQLSYTDVRIMTHEEEVAFVAAM